MWVLTVALGCGCASTPKAAETPQEYAENARIAYEEALVEYFDGDWEIAIPMFEEVRRRYAYSRYARLAALRIGDAEFERGNSAEAVAAYRSFVHDYPNDVEVPYARFKVAKSLFQETGDNVLMPPLEERDLVTVTDAYGTIRAVLRDYPAYKRRPELVYMLEVVSGLLARHELYVARFYLREDRFDAAVARILYSIKTYPDSGLVAEGLVLLGETYLMMQRDADARAAFERVLNTYSDSAFTVPARQYLARMGKASAPPAPEAEKPSSPKSAVPPATATSPESPNARL